MVKYTLLPQTRFTIGTKEYINDRLTSMSIIGRENGFATGTLVLKENLSDLWPDVVTNNTPVKVDVKGEDEGSWTNMFEGVCRFPILPIELKETLMLKCDGLGYGLGDNFVAQEYGTQSNNPTLNSLQTILTNLTKGIIPAWINKYMETANPTGFGYSTAKIENVPGEISYVSFFKPGNKCIDDLLDLATALQDGDPGPHWIVTPGVSPDTNKYFRLKTIGEDQVGWTSYYGGNQALATLQEGNDRDFVDGRFEPIGKEANVIYYKGIWRRPSNGDSWTNPASDADAQAFWVPINDHGHASAVTRDITYNQVGTSAVRLTNTMNLVFAAMEYALPYAYDFSLFTDPLNLPALNFYGQTNAYVGTDGPYVQLIESKESDGFGGLRPYKYFQINLREDSIAEAGAQIITANDTPTAVSLPLGPVAGVTNNTKARWHNHNGASWSNINWIRFEAGTASINAYFVLDGLNFGGASIMRIAREKWPSEGGTLGYIDPATGLCANPVRAVLITDDQGKDDSLNAADDRGLMAQFAKAELLRRKKEAIAGYFQTHLLKDLLPGQFLHIHAKPTRAANTYAINKDMRVPQVVHNVSVDPAVCSSIVSVTDDLTNSRARLRYSDQNKIYEMMRAGFQDRQAASIVSGNMDIRIPRLEKAY